MKARSVASFPRMLQRSGRLSVLVPLQESACPAKGRDFCSYGLPAKIGLKFSSSASGAELIQWLLNSMDTNCFWRRAWRVVLRPWSWLVANGCAVNVADGKGYAVGCASGIENTDLLVTDLLGRNVSVTHLTATDFRLMLARIRRKLKPGSQLEFPPQAWRIFRLLPQTGERLAKPRSKG